MERRDLLYDKAYALAEGLVQSYPEGTTFRLLENSFESSLSTEYTSGSILNYLTEKAGWYR